MFSGTFSDGPTLEHEVRRRKAENTAVEFWYYMRNKLKSLREKAGSSEIGTSLGEIIQDATGYQK